MVRSIILLTNFLLVFQVQAFSGADIIGEWEWLGDSVGQYADPDSAVRTNQTHIILFTDKERPKARYYSESNQVCNDCGGHYALLSTKGDEPVFEYNGIWNFDSDLLVIKRKAVYQRAGSLVSSAQRVTYNEDKKILVLGGLLSHITGGKFSYYKKRLNSSVSVSPYYSKVNDKIVIDIDISKIKLGMSPKSVIKRIRKDFVINDIVQFDKYNKLVPYVESITAVLENKSKIDKYTFNFAQPPYVNRLLSIHRYQQFVFKDDMENKPPAMAHVKNILIKKYGEAKAIINANKDVGDKQKEIVISWFNKLKSCNTQFEPNTSKPECPLLFDAQLSGFSKDDSRFPGIATLLELHLINYPAIVQNGKASYRQKKMHEVPKQKQYNKKSLEFEL